MVSPESPPAPSNPSTEKRLRTFAEHACLWGGIGVIAGAAAATVNMAILFAVGGIAIIFAVFLAPLCQKLIWNAGASVLILAALWGLWKITPKPKEPPTAQENAAAVVALEDQRAAEKQAAQQASLPQSTPPPVTVPTSSKRPKPSEPPQVRGLVVLPAQPPPRPYSSAPAVAHFTVTQSEDVSSHADAPHLTRVVIQTNVEFLHLKLALQCDGPIVEGRGGTGGVMMMVSEGVANGYPNVFVFTYGSAIPPFGPSSPITISLWSKQPIHCDQATTF